MRSMMDDTNRSRSLYAIAGGRSLGSVESTEPAKALPAITALWFMASGFFVSAAIVSAFLCSGHGLASVATVLGLSASAIASFVIGSLAWPGAENGSFSPDDDAEYTDWENVQAVLNSAAWLMLSGSLLTLTVFFTAFQWQLGYNLVAVSLACGAGSLVANLIGFGIFDASSEAVEARTYTMLPLPKAPAEESAPALSFAAEPKVAARPVQPEQTVFAPTVETPATEPEVEFESLDSVAIVDEKSAAELLELLVSLESFALDESPAIKADELLEKLESLAIEGFPALDSEQPVPAVAEARTASRVPVKVEF